MFELPSAKRVKRSELFSTISSSEDEHDGENPTRVNQPKKNEKRPMRDEDDERAGQQDSMQLDCGFEYDFITREPVPKPHSTPEPSASVNPIDKGGAHSTAPTVEQPQEQSYEFNLFAPKPKPKLPLSTTTTTTTQAPTPSSSSTSNQPPNLITIRSHSPTPTLSSGTILHPRPPSYYFTSFLPVPRQQDLKLAYATSAVTPTQLTFLLHTPWPGTHLPWRTTHLATSSRHASHTPTVAVAVAAAAEPGTRTRTRPRPRPSKKRRIQTRQRIAARAALVEQGKKDEEAEREKRTRRNREKKVKRKMREKAKKEEKGGEKEGEGRGGE